MEKLSIFIIALLVANHSFCVVCQNSLDAQAIRIAKEMDSQHEAIERNLLKNYNPKLRPNETGDPVYMTAFITILKVKEIEEIVEAFTLDFYLSLYWHDYRLRHNASKWITYQAEAVKSIWTPDIYFPTALESKKHSVTKENKFLFVKKNGDVGLDQRITTKAACKLDLHNFPLDSHKCVLEIQSWAAIQNVVVVACKERLKKPGVLALRWIYFASTEEDYCLKDAYPHYDLVLDWDKSGAYAIKETSVAEYTVASIKTESGTQSGAHGLSQLRIIMTYKRRLGYYILQVYIPCSLVVMSSWLSFWLSGDEPGDRISLGITSMLAIVFLLQFINASLPKVSYAKGIDYYLIACFVQVFCGLAETVYVAGIAKDESKESKKKNKKSINGKENCVSLYDEPIKPRKASAPNDATNAEDPARQKKSHQNSQKMAADRVDNISKIIFPAVFVIFNLVYWLYYVIF